MKLIDAVNEVNNLKANFYDLPEKIKWLSRLDRRIFDDILMTHELSEEEQEPFIRAEGEEPKFMDYTEEDQDTELIVGAPYDEMYVLWLSAQIDWNNREIVGFNNSNAMFESVYKQFQNAYNRSHMPKGCEKRYF